MPAAARTAAKRDLALMNSASPVDWETPPQLYRAGLPRQGVLSGIVRADGYAYQRATISCRGRVASIMTMARCASRNAWERMPLRALREISHTLLWAIGRRAP